MIDMLNVLIHEPDNYHRLGMSELLCDVFNVEYQEELAFSTIITPESVWNADIIILSLTRGESYTCKKELRYRNRGGIFGITDSNPEVCGNKPLCYDDIHFLERRFSKAKIQDEVIHVWNNNKYATHYPCKYSCNKCNHKKLSIWEERIAQEIINGTSLEDIAKNLI